MAAVGAKLRDHSQGVSVTTTQLFRPRAAVVSEFLRQLRDQGDAGYPLLVIVRRLAPTFGESHEFYLSMLRLLEESGDVLASNIGNVRRWTAL